MINVNIYYFTLNFLILQKFNSNYLLKLHINYIIIKNNLKN